MREPIPPQLPPPLPSPLPILLVRSPRGKIHLVDEDGIPSHIGCVVNSYGILYVACGFQCYDRRLWSSSHLSAERCYVSSYEGGLVDVTCERCKSSEYYSTLEIDELTTVDAIK